MRAHARNALDKGGRVVTPVSMEWKAAGDCLSPVMRTMTGRPERSPDPIWLHRYSQRDLPKDETTRPYFLDLEVPCRRCAPCLRRRGRHWAARAADEIGASHRTWFGTLTLSPSSHALMTIRASARLRKGGTDINDLSPADLFLERHAEISRELTLWLKRVRKMSATKLRFALVAEAHKSGLPHYHVLIHEIAGPVRYAVLQHCWKIGFSSFKLVKSGDESRAAWYVAKYLSKAALARVRASTGYGAASQITPLSAKRPPASRIPPPSLPPLAGGEKPINRS